MGSDMNSPPVLMLLFDFNPRSPHGERLRIMRLRPLHLYFNPRSPHGERRLYSPGKVYVVYNFNPRSPHGERPKPTSEGLCSIKFQSTLPAWGATSLFYGTAFCGIISIHAPRMGSDILSLLTCGIYRNFNPRSPHGERHSVHVRDVQLFLFQSTLPAWGATRCRLRLPMLIFNFNPRSPHGERPDAG